MATYQLVARAGLDASQLTAGLQQTAGQIEQFAKGANAKLGNMGAASKVAADQARNALFSKMQGFVGMGPGGALISGISGIHPAVALAVVGLSKLRDGIAATVDAFAVQERANKRLRSVIEAAGSPGVSIRQIEKFAGERQARTNFGDEQTLGAAATLASFENIQGDTFLKTIAAAQDASAFRGESLDAMILKFGKALNDPASKLGELAESGIAFSTAEVQAIKAIQQRGDIEGAQAKILEKLNATFGGAAEDLADPVTQLKNAFGDVLEVVGAFFKPIIDEFARSLTPIVAAFGDPALRDGVYELGQRIAPLVVDFAQLALGVPGILSFFVDGAELAGGFIGGVTSIVETINDSFIPGLDSMVAGMLQAVVSLNDVADYLVPDDLAASAQAKVDELLPAILARDEELRKKRTPEERARGKRTPGDKDEEDKADKSKQATAQRVRTDNALLVSGTAEAFKGIRESLAAARKDAVPKNPVEQKIEANTDETAENTKEMTDILAQIQKDAKTRTEPRFQVVEFP